MKIEIEAGEVVAILAELRNLMATTKSVVEAPVVKPSNKPVPIKAAAPVIVKKAEASKKRSPGRPSGSTGPTIKQQIMAMLEKQPLPSAVIIKALIKDLDPEAAKQRASSGYQVLKQMRDNRIIKTENVNGSVDKYNMLIAQTQQQESDEQ
jgi:hypothetical protein